jgi:putative holliday junction resolvase
VRLLGVDYGRKRIGLALSDATGLLARPWKTIVRDGDAAQVVDAIVAELETLAADGEPVGAVVLGLPRRLNGEPSEQTAAVEAVASRLRARLTIPVAVQDERLTSREAESRLAEREKDWRKRKRALDAAAAAIILQDYLDAAPRAAVTEEEDV